jgi:hypothetical protein
MGQCAPAQSPAPQFRDVQYRTNTRAPQQQRPPCCISRLVAMHTPPKRPNSTRETTPRAYEDWQSQKRAEGACKGVSRSGPRVRRDAGAKLLRHRSIREEQRPPWKALVISTSVLRLYRAWFPSIRSKVLDLPEPRLYALRRSPAHAYNTSGGTPQEGADLMRADAAQFLRS